MTTLSLFLAKYPNARLTQCLPRKDGCNEHRVQPRARRGVEPEDGGRERDVRHREEEVEPDARDDDGCDVDPARADLDGLEDHVAEDARECRVPRHEAVDQAAREGRNGHANEADEAEEADAEPAAYVSKRRLRRLHGATHVEKRYGAPPRRKVSVTQKALKHAAARSRIRLAWSKTGSVTAKVPMLPRMWR
jgi:hypothetical protein